MCVGGGGWHPLSLIATQCTHFPIHPPTQHHCTAPTNPIHAHTYPYHSTGKSAILKYAFPITVDDVVLDAEGEVKELKVTADKEGSGPKPKGKRVGWGWVKGRWEGAAAFWSGVCMCMCLPTQPNQTKP